MSPFWDHCGEELVTVSGDPMSSAVRRFRCDACRLDYVMDAGGLLLEVHE